MTIALSASGFYSLYQLAEPLQVCCFTGVRLSKALMIRLIPSRDERNEFWFIPDPCKKLSGPRFFTIAEKSFLNYHVKNKSPPLIPKLEEDILLHPDTLDLVRETQFMSVVQKLHWLMKNQKACILNDFHVKETNKCCVDLVVRIYLQEQQVDQSKISEEWSKVCEERNIYYREVLLSSMKRIDNAFEYLRFENICFQSLPIFVGCFRSYWTCQLLAEIEKWQHFET